MAQEIVTQRQICRSSPLSLTPPPPHIHTPLTRMCRYMHVIWVFKVEGLPTMCAVIFWFLNLMSCPPVHIKTIGTFKGHPTLFTFLFLHDNLLIFMFLWHVFYQFHIRQKRTAAQLASVWLDNIWILWTNKYLMPISCNATGKSLWAIGTLIPWRYKWLSSWKMKIQN